MNQKMSKSEKYLWLGLFVGVAFSNIIWFFIVKYFL